MRKYLVVHTNMSGRKTVRRYTIFGIIMMATNLFYDEELKITLHDGGVIE